MRAMQFQPPNRNRQNKFNSFTVYPYILRKKKEIESNFAEEMRKDSGLSCSFDVGHNHSRGSQGATGCFVHDDVVKFTRTDTTSPSWKKEANILKEILDLTINEEKLDIKEIAIDDNKTNQLIISGYKRINAENEEYIGTHQIPDNCK